jgi:hypothetical protein
MRISRSDLLFYAGLAGILVGSIWVFLPDHDRYTSDHVLSSGLIGLGHFLIAMSWRVQLTRENLLVPRYESRLCRLTFQLGIWLMFIGLGLMASLLFLDHWNQQALSWLFLTGIVVRYVGFGLMIMALFLYFRATERARLEVAYRPPFAT